MTPLSRSALRQPRTDKDGNRFEGTYLDDVRDGNFVEKDRNGKVTAQGSYTRGHRQIK